MMLKRFFLLTLFLILSSNNIFAQDTLGNKAKGGKTYILAALRDIIMDEVMDKITMQREKAMEEALHTSSRSKGKKQFFFKPVARNFTQRPAIKNNNSATNFISIQNSRNALGFHFESENEKRKIESSSLPTQRSRLLLEESLQTEFKGSVYHPNFANFDINLESGLRQAREEFQPNLTGKMKNSNLNQFHIISSLLRKKPYAFSLLADKSRWIESREFFERQAINSTRYAGNFGLKNKFIPVSFSFSNSSKTIDRASRPSQNFDDDELSLSLDNESWGIGATRFEVAQNKFSRTESGTPDQKGTARDFNLSNQKSLSQDNKKSLYSSLHYYDLTGTAESSILNLNENFNIEHTDQLTGSYAYNFSDRSSSGAKTRDNRVNASLRHRLYESLTSSFSTYYFNSDATAFSQDAYGLSLDEDYRKKLGKIGRLSLGVGLNYSEEKRKTLGNILSIIDESQTLTTGTVTLLDKPDVDTATVVVTDLTGTTTYILNVDYQLSSVGERTQIQRIPAGSISNGQKALVDYQARGSPFLKFNTLGENFRFRIDFLDELVGAYYRLAREGHPKESGQDDFILQTLSDTAIGLDFNYKNLSVELENEDYDSDLSPYKRLRFRESILFNPTEESTLTLQSSQIIVRLVNTQDTQRFFDCLSRYSVGLNRYSRFNIEAGLRWQEGIGIGLNDLFAGVNYELNFGKLLMDIKYDFKRQLYLGDRLANHFFFIKTKRTF